MLTDSHIHPTIPASNLQRAKAFYAEKLGLIPAEEAPGGLVYKMNDSWFVLYPTPSAGTAQHTLAGFTTDNIEREVTDLKKRGVVFEDYDMPNFKTVNSVYTAPDRRAAWFKDSEGNILGIVQFL